MKANTNARVVLIGDVNQVSGSGDYEYVNVHLASDQELIECGLVKFVRLVGILDGLRNQLEDLPWWHNPTSIPKSVHERCIEHDLNLKIQFMVHVVRYLKSGKIVKCDMP
jgi:hypothetical protein